MNLTMMAEGFTLTELKEMDEKEKYMYYYFIVEKNKELEGKIEDLKKGKDSNDEEYNFVTEEEFVSKVR